MLSVDDQLNAKIADLELGSSSLEINFQRHQKSRNSTYVSRSWSLFDSERDKSKMISGVQISNLDSTTGESDNESRDFDSDVVVVEDLLAHWLAPEVP